MRFLGKYELLEQLTVGRVETFIAYPIGGGERILVHVFPLPALIKSAPTNRDLVDYMQELSPPALGAVLDAGRYDDGSQAYIVTKFPRDLGELPKWVDAYKSMTKKHDTTAEVPAPALWETSSGDTQPIPVAEKPVGDFTRAFPGVGPTKEPGNPTSATDAFDKSQRESVHEETNLRGDRQSSAGPGSLTQQWMAGLGVGAQLPRSEAIGPEKSGGATRTPAPPRQSFGEDPWPTNAFGTADDPARVPARTGEFTMFFKSPFAAPSDSLEPQATEEPFTQPPPRPAEGEFTKLFGSASPAASGSPLVAEPLEPATQGDGSTQIFGKSPALASSQPAPSPAADSPTRAETPARYVVTQNTNLPPVPGPIPSIEPVFSSGTSPNHTILGQGNNDGATRLFRPPAQDAPATPLVTPQGESEYTQIISPKPKPAGPVERPPSQPAPPIAAPMGLQMPWVPPPVPSIQVSAPPMAVAPAVPAMQWPAPPAIATPKAAIPPPGPQAGKKTQGWTAYVPLIVILNLLVLAAVGLVLYFILKH
jgi:hypothetical protein